MSTPAWIPETFAAVMLLVAEVSAGQLAVARAWTRRGGAGADIAVFRLLTGIALAGMLVHGLSTMPNAAWEVAFAAMTAWFAWCLWREGRGRGSAVARGHYAPHLVSSAAMLYIFAALAGSPTAGSGVSDTGGMSGMAGWSSSGMPALHAPALALIFALLLIAFTVHDLDRQAGVDGYFHAVGRRPLSALAVAAAGRASGAGPVPPTESAPRAGPAARLLLSPAVVKGCQVATGVTMAFILVMLI
jgi:Domain of unknown function (DUF5134)